MSELDDPARHARHPARERAPRVRVTAPVAFRRVTDAVWSRGATLDISRSGVLFVPAAGPAPDGDLLMVVFLSQVPRRTEAGAPLADLHCGGRVARVTTAPGGEPALAVQIEFEWAEKPPDPTWGPSYD